MTPVEIECNEIISFFNDFIFTLCQYIHWRDVKLYVIKKDESMWINFFKFTIPIVFTSPSVYNVQYLLVSKVINFKCLNEYFDFTTILILLWIGYTNKMNYGSGKVKSFVFMALLKAWFTLFWILNPLIPLSACPISNHFIQR